MVKGDYIMKKDLVVGHCSQLTNNKNWNETLKQIQTGRTAHILDDIRIQLLDLQFKNNLHNDVDKLVDILIDLVDILKSK
jgi:hypothetical protein